MMNVKPHRLWIGMLTLACIIGFGHAPLIGMARQNQQNKLANIDAAKVHTDQTLQQLRADIEATEKLKTEIGVAEAEKTLAPVDRLRMAQILERRAAESRLSHFSYTLSPERKTSVESVGAGMQDLATSDVSISADAPTDLDAYVYIDALRHSLAGRFTVRQLSLQRKSGDDANLTAANIKMSLTGEWLSNGARQNPEREAP